MIASALAQLAALFPDLDPQPVLNAYLAEGVDQDDDGCYSERSPAIYDAVTNRSLLLLTRKVPLGLAASYLLTGNAEAAHYLWEHAPAPALSDLFWLALALGRDMAPSSPQLADFARFYPANGWWRLRRGQLSASLFPDTTRLLHLVSGTAELIGLKISQCYFGVGNFAAESLRVTGNTAVLRSEGTRYPRRPGYELPLGEPVPAAAWEPAMARRQLRPLPPPTSELVVREVTGGFDCEYRTLAGMDRVPAQIAFDFAPGSEWNGRKTAAGDVIFLTTGTGQMRYGADLIAIGPGNDAHRMSAMRDRRAGRPLSARADSAADPGEPPVPHPHNSVALRNHPDVLKTARPQIVLPDPEIQGRCQGSEFLGAQAAQQLLMGNRPGAGKVRHLLRQFPGADAATDNQRANKEEDVVHVGVLTATDADVRGPASGSTRQTACWPRQTISA